MKAIHCRRVSHMNLVLEDFDASVAHLRDLYDAEFLMDLPSPQWHACLMEIGGVILELFVPPTFLLNSRYGPHHVGIEYEADMDEVRAVVAARGIRIIRDIGAALHTHPTDGFGAAFEFFGGTFFSGQYLTTPLKPASYWRDQHPLQLLGLKAYTMAVYDIEAASRFLQSFLGAKPSYEDNRREVGARVIGLKLADCDVELLTPQGEGALQQEMRRSGEGILSTVFRTASTDAVRAYFKRRGVPLIAGTAPDRIAVAPAANLGVRFEFAK